MNETERSHTVRYTDRWFCYLDLLGFERLVQTGDIQDILPLYEEVLSHLDGAVQGKSTQGISPAWFSDTFIIFSRTGRPEQFALIEQASRLFFRELILRQIPVRGALSYGKLYTQQERNIFIGPALVDAYRYGEGQNWLGFVLTPSAQRALESNDLPLKERLNYRQVSDSGVLKSGVNGPIYAFNFNSGNEGRQNPFIAPLESMRNIAGSKHRKKYDRTLEFLRGNAA